MKMPFSDDWSQYFRLLHSLEQKGLLVNRANMAIKHAGSMGLFHGKVLLGPLMQLPGLHDPNCSPCYRSAIVTNQGIGLIGFISSLDDWENPDGWTVVTASAGSLFVPYAEWPASVQFQILQRLVDHIRHLTHSIRQLEQYHPFL